MKGRTAHPRPLRALAFVVGHRAGHSSTSTLRARPCICSRTPASRRARGNGGLIRRSKGPRMRARRGSWRDGERETRRTFIWVRKPALGEMQYRRFWTMCSASSQDIWHSCITYMITNAGERLIPPARGRAAVHDRGQRRPGRCRRRTGQREREARRGGTGEMGRRCGDAMRCDGEIGVGRGSGREWEGGRRAYRCSGRGRDRPVRARR